MRPSARELKDATSAYVLAKNATSTLIHRLASAVAQDLANQMGGKVRVNLPGGVHIERAPQEQNVNVPAIRRA